MISTPDICAYINKMILKFFLFSIELIFYRPGDSDRKKWLVSVCIIEGWLFKLFDEL